MEESEKRRQRLKALQFEAAHSGDHKNADSTSPSGFTNPFLDTNESNPVDHTFTLSPRFDYYTDPMAAFSTNKRNKVDNQYYQHQFASPRTASPATRHFRASCSPEPTCYRSPGFTWRSPGIPRHLASSNSSSGSNPSSFCSTQGHILGHSASPNWSFGGSPTPDSRKGRGQWRVNSSPSPYFGSSAQLGQKLHRHVSALDRPDRFYKKSMVEDPWESLTPVVFRVKKVESPAVLHPPVAIGTPVSQQSLAEYLAAAFDEASRHTPGD